MQPHLHVAHLRAEGAVLLAAQEADPTATVPSCPGWDRTRLLAHVAGVHAWARSQLERGADNSGTADATRQVPAGDELGPWYAANLAALADGLDAMDTASTWPTWAGPQPGTFYPRRMAQETTMHRWDADHGPIDPALATDGVDEHLELFSKLIAGEKFGDRAGTIHLHSTDAGLGDAGEWLVRVGSDGISFEKGHAKGDVALRGTASDLLLWTWNRVPVDDRFEVFGEATLLELWRTTVVI
jgi:uncharacterized protein (TIGR03083 family)